MVTPWKPVRNWLDFGTTFEATWCSWAKWLQSGPFSSNKWDPSSPGGGIHMGALGVWSGPQWEWRHVLTFTANTCSSNQCVFFLGRSIPIMSPQKLLRCLSWPRLPLVCGLFGAQVQERILKGTSPFPDPKGHPKKPIGPPRNASKTGVHKVPLLLGTRSKMRLQRARLSWNGSHGNHSSKWPLSGLRE